MTLPHERVTAELLAHGWVLPVRRVAGSTLAEKYVPTAVGIKEAWAGVYEGDHESCAWVIGGCYLSEDRNVLVTCKRLIPIGATDADVTRLAREFAADAEKQIADSYAVRLLALGVGPERNQPAPPTAAVAQAAASRVRPR